MNGRERKANRRSQPYEWTADQIRALRQHMGFTQREMADELAVRQQTISEWETGLHQPHRSTQKTLVLIAERAGFSYQVSCDDGVEQVAVVEREV